MASVNWLGFSLSPQELPSHEEDHSHSQTVAPRLGFNSDGSISGECFDSSAAHSLNNLPPPFAIFEALNANNTHTSHPQDWSTKGLGSNSSEDNYNNNNNNNNQNLILGTSCSNQILDSNQQQQPKLENFLGGHSFGDNVNNHPTLTYGANNSASSSADFMFPNCSLQLPSPQPPEKSSVAGGGAGGGGGGGSGSPKNSTSIGLSMIKTWLRNQPPPQSDSANISLSMSSTVSQSSSSVALPLLTANVDNGDSSSSDNKQAKTSTTVDDNQRGGGGAIVESPVPRKSIDTFGQRTSIYRGVTRHRWTGRYEAHLWDNSCRREGQTRKGRQVYLGGYDKEEKAARAYDLAALKYWGTTTTTNFPISHYEKELEEMKHMTRQEYVASLRRKSSGFSRGASIYRGVTRHHQHGRWQARIGRVAGNKDLYLGTFSTQEEAAEAYDIAAIKFRGLNAVTNFDMSRYDVKSILESSTLPIGAAAKRLKDVEQVDLTVDNNGHSHRSSEEDGMMSSHLSYGSTYHGWPSLAFQQPQPYSQLHFNTYGQKLWCKQEQDSDDHASQTFQDIHQLQLGNTHNFFHSNNSGLQSMMSIDSASIDNNSSGSSSVIYGGHGNGYGGGGCYVIPMATTTTFIANESNQNERSNNGYGDDEVKTLGYENVYSSNDPYHARILHYLSQHTSADAVNASANDACNTWVPTAIPTLAPRPTNMAVYHGAPPFTLLHE